MKKTGLILFLCLAALVILFPTVGRLLPQPAPTGDLNEKRALAEWPTEAKNAKAWIQGVEDWFNDHLAFREQFIEAGLHADLALGESPASSVLLGTHDWLFYVETDENADVRREIVLDEEEKENLVAIQSDTQEYLRELGAAYYVLIAPNKQTIYPEYLPLSVQPGQGPSRLDQIYEVLKEKTEVPFLDVRPALLAAKGDKPLYYRYDSHWNETGAYAAFLSVAETLKKDFPTLYIPTPEEMSVDPDGTFNGDLASMIGMGGKMVDKCEWYHFPGGEARVSPEESTDMITAWVNPDHPEAPKILLLNDSFGASLITFLKESCSVLYETSSGDLLSYEELLYGHPDIVIYEKVERFAMALAAE